MLGLDVVSMVFGNYIYFDVTDLYACTLMLFLMMYGFYERTL